MGLRIIYGKSGSGKSELCFNEIAKLVKTEKKIYVITPEQFSFTAEKKLMDNLEEKSVINAEVITLSRMAHRVLLEVGENDKTRLTKTGRAMLVHHILSENIKKLKFLGKSEENTNVINTSIKEFKKHGISVQNLEEESENLKDKYLKTKLEDIILIYKEFEEKIKNRYIEENDILTSMLNHISDTDTIKDSIIYIDEFAGFTKQEYMVLNAIMHYSKQVNITLCIDKIETNTNPDIDIYYSNKITLKRLLDNAKEHNIEIEELLECENQYRFKTNELKHLANNMYAHKSTVYAQNVDSISIFLAKNQYTEIENIAKTIKKLVIKDTYRYKDIAIITKNLGTYSSLVKNIFSSYEIPIFIDEKRELSQNIVVKFVLAILEVISSNFANYAVFNYLKIGFLDIDKNDIYKLENYAIKWGIKNGKWKLDFKYGKGEKNSEDENKEIDRLNEIRKKVVQPIMLLKENIDKEKTFLEISKEIYKFLIKQNIEKELDEKILKLEEQGLFELAQEYMASYKIVLDILEEISEIFNDEKTTYDKYNKILKIGLKNSGLGKIPGTNDQVIFGDIERSRSHKVKAVFLVGLNDGSFPSVNKDEGFFNDLDREKLKNDGLEIAKGTLENIYEDNFNIYKAFTTAEEKIYLSYSSSDNLRKFIKTVNIN